MATVTAALWTA